MSITQSVIDALLLGGAMTAREIADTIDRPINHVCAVLHRLQHAQTQRIYIAKYRRDQDGGRLYPRAVYALGVGFNAKRPPPLTDTEYGRRLRDRKRFCVRSVFDLGGRIDSKRVAFNIRTLGK